MTTHLPGISGRPACGVRGVMSLEWSGGDSTAAGYDISGVQHPLVDCRRCRVAMDAAGFPTIRDRWRHWLAADIAGRTPEAEPGSTYVAQV